jgi:ribosome-associated protein
MSGGDVRSPQSFFVTAVLDAAILGADEKLGGDTVVLDLRGLQETFDAIVVTSGRNDRQVRAIADEIEHQVERSLDVKPSRVEGLTTGEWVAIDYGDVIIHVFLDAAREYYDLEHLWSAAPAFRPQLQR